MPDRPFDLSLHARRLRQTFDQSFARALQTDDGRQQDFLQIRLNGVVHMLSLDEVASLQALNRVTPIPGPLPSLLGIIGHKGDIVPVYDLRIVLGLPATLPVRWMVLNKSGLLALAFDAFDKHVRHPESAVARPASGAAEGEHIRLSLRVDGVNWPIVNLASVSDGIQDTARQCAQQQEF